MKFIAALPLVLLLLGSTLQAQNQPTDPDNQGNTPNGTNTNNNNNATNETDGPRRFWQANVAGGNYMVAIDRISSISKHSYLIDGAAVVHEVTIDTTGQALARFYYIEPPKTASTAANQLIDRSKQLVDEYSKRSGNDVSTMVVKKYPETTHAKSIEYRLLSEAEINALYNSVKDAWETGRGRKFNVK